MAAQQGPDTFHWVDFHAVKDQSVVVWVERSLTVEDWSAIREIGVEYDSAIVVTTKRANPQAAANGDSFAIWSAYGTDAWPTQYLFDKHGKLRKTFVGEGYDDDVEAAVKALIAER